MIISLRPKNQGKCCIGREGEKDKKSREKERKIVERGREKKSKTNRGSSRRIHREGQQNRNRDRDREEKRHKGMVTTCDYRRSRNWPHTMISWSWATRRCRPCWRLTTGSRHSLAQLQANDNVKKQLSCNSANQDVKGGLSLKAVAFMTGLAVFWIAEHLALRLLLLEATVMALIVLAVSAILAVSVATQTQPPFPDIPSKHG